MEASQIDVKMPGHECLADDVSPGQTRIVRVLTVVAYICSVSMAAVMLSLYYVFLWDPKPNEVASKSLHSAKLVADPGLGLPPFGASQ